MLQAKVEVSHNIKDCGDSGEDPPFLKESTVDSEPLGQGQTEVLRVFLLHTQQVGTSARESASV